MTKSEIYFSIDIEADGPSPGLNSMLSFAAVSFEIKNHTLINLGNYESNLELLEGAITHPDTQKFWDRFPVAYQATRKETKHPAQVMQDFRVWIKAKVGDIKPICVCYPATYDFKWIDWYFHKFCGDNPFGFSALDMKSYANGMLRHKHFSSTNKKNFPKEWFNPDLKHTHVALDDALEQAYIFVEMRKANIKNG